MDGAGFDQAFAEQLERQAQAAGESVQTYVQRAVAGRMIGDMARRDDPQLDSLREQFATAGIQPHDATGALGGASAMASDPRRLRALAGTGLLDGPPDPAYDRIVRTTAEALGTPAAALTLLDRHRLFFVSAVGIAPGLAAARELPLGGSIGQFVVESEHTVVIEDARNHPSLANLSFVLDGNVIGYLGVPLIDPDGYAIGSLSVWDGQPRLWSTGHIETLHNFARMTWLCMFGSSAA